MLSCNAAMAAIIRFRVGGDDIQYPFEVEESNGEVSITKVASAVKMMRQAVDDTLNKYVEAEKKRGLKQGDVVVSGKDMEEDDDDDDSEDDDSDDNEKDGGDDNGDDTGGDKDKDNVDCDKDSGIDYKDYNEKSAEQCSPDSKKQRIEQ